MPKRKTHFALPTFTMSANKTMATRSERAAIKMAWQAILEANMKGNEPNSAIADEGETEDIERASNRSFLEAEATA